MYLVGINPTRTHASPEFKPGTIGQDANGYFHKYVQYLGGTGSVAAVDRQVAYYNGDTGYEDNEVTSDLSDSVNLGAGVLNSAPASGHYCWVQLTGPATLALALTAGADGNALTAVGATDGTLDVSAAVTDAIVAFASDASAKKIICCFPL